MTNVKEELQIANGRLGFVFIAQIYKKGKTKTIFLLYESLIYNVPFTQ